MSKATRIPRGPLSLRCSDAGYSTCGSAHLRDLDWTNWSQDFSFDSHYLHVRRAPVRVGLDDETWHRVYPKRVNRRVCNRIAVVNGIPHWLYDTKPTTKAPCNPASP